MKHKTSSIPEDVLRFLLLFCLHGDMQTDADFMRKKKKKSHTVLRFAPGLQNCL